MAEVLIRLARVRFPALVNHTEPETFCTVVARATAALSAYDVFKVDCVVSGASQVLYSAAVRYFGRGDFWSAILLAIVLETSFSSSGFCYLYLALSALVRVIENTLFANSFP